MDLLALLLERLGERVVRLDDGERLDEEGLPRARLFVDDPGDALAPVRADREAVAPPFLRDVAVGEDVGPRADELLEPPDDLAPEADDRGADGGEPDGGGVADPAVGLEDDVPLRQEALEVAERPQERGQVGKVDSLDGDGVPRLLGALDEAEEVEQLLGGKGLTCGAEPEDERCRLVEAEDADGRLEPRARHEVARHAGTAADLLRIPGRSRSEKPFAAPLRRTETPGEP